MWHNSLVHLVVPFGCSLWGIRFLSENRVSDSLPRFSTSISALLYLIALHVHFLAEPIPLGTWMYVVNNPVT